MRWFWQKKKKPEDKGEEATAVETPVEDTAAPKDEPKIEEAPALPEPEDKPVAEPEPLPEPQPSPEPEKPSSPAPVIADPLPAAPVPAEVEPEKDEKPKDSSDGDKSKKANIFARFSSGLKRSSSRLGEGVTSIFTKRKLDAETLEELEDLLISSDLGTALALRFGEALSKDRFDKDIDEREVREALASLIADDLHPLQKKLDLSAGPAPQVVLFVGVNGSGKTTTLGKIAAKLNDDGKKVLMVAGDTFRAAAIEQLKVWSERTNTPVIAREIGADAAGLAFDALARAKKEGADIVLMDTAGRLQNKTELMEELRKIVRVIKKQDESAPHHVILVLDATVGQNALSQAEAFLEAAGVTGLVMTKLDGTAKGGVLVAVSDRFHLPIHYIGIGEGIEDLQDFDAESFAGAIAGLTE